MKRGARMERAAHANDSATRLERSDAEQSQPRAEPADQGSDPIGKPGKSNGGSVGNVSAATKKAHSNWRNSVFTSRLRAARLMAAKRNDADRQTRSANDNAKTQPPLAELLGTIKRQRYLRPHREQLAWQEKLEAFLARFGD